MQLVLTQQNPLPSSLEWIFRVNERPALFSIQQFASKNNPLILIQSALQLPGHLFSGINKISLETNFPSKDLWMRSHFSVSPLEEKQWIEKPFDVPPNGKEKRRVLFLPAGKKFTFTRKNWTGKGKLFFSFTPSFFGENNNMELKIWKTEAEKELLEKVNLSGNKGEIWEEMILPVSSPSFLEFHLTQKDSSQEKFENTPGNFGIYITEPLFIEEKIDKKIKTKKSWGEKKNLILISLDTVRADHLQTYGYQRGTSPTLDQIAEKGVLFNNAFTPAGYTLPAHASLFTGVFSSKLLKPHSVSLTSQQDILQGFMQALSSFPENLPTLFQKSGYLTAAFTGGGLVDGILGFSNGFSRYADFPIELNFKDKTGPVFKNGIQWLRSNAHKGNFFLFLHTYEAHSPHFHQALIRHPEKGGRVAAFHQDISAGGLIHLPDYPTNSTLEVTKEEKEYAVDLYDSSLLFLDHYLALLMEELEKLKLLENTSLVILSDHGEDIWDHTWWGHGEMFNEVLQVPLIFYNFLDVNPGAIIEEPVSLLDVFPTLVEQFELTRKNPYPLDGKNLLRLFTASIKTESLKSKTHPSKESPFHSSLFSEHLVFEKNLIRRLGLRQDQWKYIAKHRMAENQKLPEILEESLFDLKNDPNEQENLSDKKPELVNSLREISGQILEKMAAPLPSSENSSQAINQDYTIQEEAELIERLKGMGYL